MTSHQHDHETESGAVSAEQVKDYLRAHPNFFEKHAALLTEITLPSPHGSGVISLAERQQLAQRDKIRVLEAMMDKMISHAEENDVTSGKVHQFSVGLLNQHSFNSLLQLIADTLQSDFAVTQSLIRIWVKPSNSAIAGNTVFTPMAEEFNDWVMALDKPHCGTLPPVAGGLFNANLQSFAFIPLFKKETPQDPFGVLILAAEDQQRFKPDMGTLYLERIGELTAAALLSQIFALHI